MKDLNSKKKRKYIVAGALGVSMVTLGVVGAAQAAQSTDEQRMFNNAGHHRDNGHLQITADMIGVSVPELQARVDNGENMHDILEAEGISKDDMRSAYKNKRQERMDGAVSNGRMTQEQANKHKAEMAGHQGNREAIQIALENSDYDAWSTAVAGTPMAEKVSIENFSKIIEAHKLREAGNHEEASTIMQELGFAKGGMKTHKMHR